MTTSARFVSELVLILLTAQLLPGKAIQNNDNWKPVIGGVDLTHFPSLAELDLTNDIGELTSNLDSFEEQHSTRRRIKKVLPEIQSIEATEHNHAELPGYRRKRFINSPTSRRALLKSLEYSKILSGHIDKMNPNASNIDTNITGIELKFYQNGLLSSLKSACPAVASKHSIMLRKVEKSAQNEIRSAFSNHLRSTMELKMEEFWTIVRKIKKCGKAFAHEQMSHKMESVEMSNKISHGSRFAGIRKHLEEEAKRFARLSQLDVIPTSENVARVFELVQGQLMTNCFQDPMKTVGEGLGELLIKTIRMKKEKRLGKIPTFHQKEMENLLQDAKTCLLKLSK